MKWWCEGQPEGIESKRHRFCLRENQAPNFDFSRLRLNCSILEANLLRMEDPDSEWAIEEYEPSKEGGTTMVKWVLNKGYGIGKKVVITGIIISSAPLVLPPLIVFSAMAVAVSVPFGVVFASYACTHKLMNKLLPTPAPPLMLEYYSDEQLEDIKQGGGCRVELDEGGDDYKQMEGGLLTILEDEKDYYSLEDDKIRRENVMQEEEEQRTEIRFKLDGNRDGYGREVGSLTRNVDEKGYYTDEDGRETETEVIRLENVVQEDEDEQMDGINPGDEIGLELDDNYRSIPGSLITKADENVEEKSYYTNENEDEKGEVQRENMIEDEAEDIKQGVEMRLGLDMARDERMQTGDGSVDEQGYEEDVGEYMEGDDDSLEEERKGEEPSVEIDRVVSLVDVNNMNTSEVDGLDVVAVEIDDEMEEIVKGSTGLLEKLRDEGRVDNVVGESDSNGFFEEVEKMEPVTVKEMDSRNLVEEGSKSEEVVVGMRQVVVLAGGTEEKNFNSRKVEELDPVAREVPNESMGSQEKTVDNSSEDAILKRKKEHLIHSNADAREIGDESGLDLFDDRNTSTNFLSLGAGDKGKENTAHDNVDVMALPTFRLAPLDSNYAKAASTTNMEVPSGEDDLDDEKMWEKIGAMRAIVGYKAPCQPTCIGELKALYVFTGVEPPASFESYADLDEVNEKLKFLMSIVGVK